MNVNCKQAPFLSWFLIQENMDMYSRVKRRKSLRRNTFSIPPHHKVLSSKKKKQQEDDDDDDDEEEEEVTEGQFTQDWNGSGFT